MTARSAATQTYVAFLRAINVGGRAVVSMADLQEAFRSAGCQAVRSYIQSGNVVFEARPDQAGALFKRISREVARLFDRCPTIVFRTADHLQQLVSSDPFKSARRESTAKFYVTFLEGAPPIEPAFPLAHSKEAIEAIGIDALDVFIVSRPKRKGFYGFPNEVIEKALGVQATSRNWSTVAKIVEFAARPVSSGGARRSTPPAPRQTTRRGSTRTRTPKA